MTVHYLEKGQHPIEIGSYRLPTKEIIKLYAVVSRWISNRSPGGIIYGKPRLGKTRAISMLEHQLKKEFGQDLQIFKMLCSQHKPNENRFYTELLRAIGHFAYNQGKAEVKKERLIKYFIERAQSSYHKKIILFIDEAHMLYESDYNWLMDIYNQLDRYNITMTVILVGQDELMFQKSAFITSSKMQIVGRFMVHEYMFSGIKSEEELEYCLRAYDEFTEYPEDSGCSYTEFFFPEAFRDGRRLSDETYSILKKFEEAKVNNNISSDFELPMQFFTLFIDNCMKTFGVNGKGIYWPSSDEWEESIKLCGYIESEMHNAMFGK